MAGVFPMEGLRAVAIDGGRHLLGHDFDAAGVRAKLGACDLLIALHAWHSPAMEQLLEGLSPRASLGFNPAYSVVIDSGHETHSVDRMFRAVRAVDDSLRVEDFAIPPEFPERSRRRAQSILDLVPENMRVLAVHADTHPSKMWQSGSWERLLRRFLNEHQDFLALIVGAHNVVDQLSPADERAISCYGLDLPTSMALVAGADAFIGIDSCMLHAADIFGIPGVGIFGPSNAAEFGFRFAPHRHVCGRNSTEGVTETLVRDALESLLSEVRLCPPSRSTASGAG